MMVETILSRSVRLICAGGMVLGVSAAFAQEAAQPMQKVEITGSRIPTLNTEGTSPVTVLGSKDIKVDGVRDVESLLNNLPQAFASQTGSVVNGSTGTATVDLRGLGPNRTLVLVDGKRLPQGSANSPSADLNQIPASLIKRVEVMTGGAGAVYGADAVAGVVNFCMNDKFEGVLFESNLNGYNHKQKNSGGVADLVASRAQSNPGQFQVPGNKGFGGKTRDASILLGSNFADGKGNATVFFSWKKEDALLQADRDFSACSLKSSKSGFACGGSSTNATGRFTAPDGNIYTVGSDGNPRAYNDDTDAYNFGPINYMQRPDTRYSMWSSAHYDINESARVYLNIAAHDDHTDAQIAPGGLFGDVYTVGYDNPYLNSAWKTALGLAKAGDTADVVVQRRNVEGGGRDSKFTNTSFRTLMGMKGDVGHWSYDVFAQFAKVRSQSSTDNYFSSRLAKNAMDATVDAKGNTVCRSAVNGTDTACVPYNVWGAAGSITPAQLAYISAPGIVTGTTEQSIYGANMGADLGDYGWKLPTTSQGVGVNFGVERRTEKLSLQPDLESQTGDLSGSGGPTKPVAGQYTVKDIFAEVRVPLLEGKPFADQLSTNGSFRHSKIDTGTNANTYGIGIDWAPIKQLRLRASHQKAVRAPNVTELFVPQGLNLFDMDSDPCSGASPKATLAQCANTGVTAAQYGKIQDSPAGQFNQLTGGSPQLKPETSKSNTFGIVVNPVKELTVSLDYFDIKVKDTISTVSPSTTLDKCLETGNSSYCSLITRDSLGTLWLLPQSRIVATNTNIGSLRTTGFDLGASYYWKIAGYGSVGLNMNGSHLSKFEVEELPGQGTYDCAGLYNGAGKCGQPRPKWRHKMRVNWNTPWAVDLAATWRHFGSADIETVSSNALLNPSGKAPNQVDRTLGRMDYLDLAATWNVNKHVTLAGGINNLFDRDPPLTSKYGTGQGNGNTFPSMYDAMGRKLFLSLAAKF